MRTVKEFEATEKIYSNAVDERRSELDRAYDKLNKYHDSVVAEMREYWETEGLEDRYFKIPICLRELTAGENKGKPDNFRCIHIIGEPIYEDRRVVSICEEFKLNDYDNKVNFGVMENPYHMFQLDYVSTEEEFNKLREECYRNMSNALSERRANGNPCEKAYADERPME